MQVTYGKRRVRTVMLAALILGAASTVSTVQASVVMNATRYVYPADAKEITVRVTNAGKLPALTQAWIDDGDEQSKPEHVDVPFNLTPPIARIEAGKSQALRISHTGSNLPADRESQFWLNILEVPPKPADTDASNTMQLAFRYRLKMFYRPDGLPGTSSGAPEKLVWSMTPEGHITVFNDSAYHVTLNDVRLGSVDDTVDMAPFAIAPHATLERKLDHVFGKQDRIEVRYQSINDYGGFVAHRKTMGTP